MLIKDEVSQKGYELIKKTLPKTDKIITEQSLNEVISLQAAKGPLQPPKEKAAFTRWFLDNSVKLAHSNYSHCTDQMCCVEEPSNEIFKHRFNMCLLEKSAGLGAKESGAFVDWFIKNLLKSEGLCQCMYLDTRGNITIGYGRLLLGLDLANPNFNLELTKLQAKEVYKDYNKVILERIKNNLKDFGVFKTCKNASIDSSGKIICPDEKLAVVASDEEIQNAINYLVDLSAKRQKSAILQRFPAKTYFNKEENPIFLDVSALDRVAKHDVEQKIKEIKTAVNLENKKCFADYDTYPVGAQLALLDMAYNVGANRLAKKFKSLTHLIMEQKWQTIANELEPTSKKPYFSRVGIQASRNEVTKILFILAAEWDKSSKGDVRDIYEEDESNFSL